jgi:GT2 family glycosyltransferase
MMPGCGPVEVSVVIPVFNPGGLLRQQLRALASQQFHESWEVVLVDNGCTDGSLGVAGEFDQQLALRVVNARDRRGAAHARNRGACEAYGQWLAFCDSDDVVAVDWLAHLWTARSGGDLVTGACDVTLLNAPALLNARGGPEYGRTLLDGPCRFLPFAPSGNLIVKRDTFLRLGGWDESLLYCEDVDFSWRAQLSGLTLSFAPEAVVHYRFRDSALGLFTQMRRYKAAEVLLYRRYRAAGATRSGIRESVGNFWWIVSRSPFIALNQERRMVWWSIAGTVVGKTQGSFQHRVVYL